MRRIENVPAEPEPPTTAPRRDAVLWGITTAGLVLGAGSSVAAALTALRPYARVLLVPAEPEDLVQLLTAWRA